MKAKLTLQLDAELIEEAKEEARRKGTSVSSLVAAYFDTLRTHNEKRMKTPPVTASLVGILAGRDLSEEDYKAYLRKRYL